MVKIVKVCGQDVIVKIVSFKDNIDIIKVLFWRDLVELLFVGKFFQMINVVVIVFNDEILIFLIFKIDLKVSYLK